jgi:hypothetical protein
MSRGKTLLLTIYNKFEKKEATIIAKVIQLNADREMHRRGFLLMKYLKALLVSMFCRFQILFYFFLCSFAKVKT